MTHTSKQSKLTFWQEHVTRLEQSGLSRREYCHNENLSYWSLRDWQKKLNSSVEKPLVKVPVKVKHHQYSTGQCLELLISDRLKIKVPENFNPEHLRRLIRVLGVEL